MILNHRLEANEVLVLELRVVTLNANNADAFLQAFKPLIAHRRKIVIDLDGVQFIDSVGISALLYCLNYLKERKGHLHLCGLSHTVNELFQLMRLHRTFKIVTCFADAFPYFEQV
jgi:anti-anti-sigma factor